uniref:Uncharacterized protein n=1 Tax=Timema tahoe TaxID=61484 RepID=A0A7R9IA81_9NEOP|nr:unnamed protein product [Timema tahoe]
MLVAGKCLSVRGKEKKKGGGRNTEGLLSYVRELKIHSLVMDHNTNTSKDLRDIFFGNIPDRSDVTHTYLLQWPRGLVRYSTADNGKIEIRILVGCIEGGFFQNSFPLSLKAIAAELNTTGALANYATEAGSQTDKSVPGPRIEPLTPRPPGLD